MKLIWYKLSPGSEEWREIETSGIFRQWCGVDERLTILPPPVRAGWGVSDSDDGVGDGGGERSKRWEACVLLVVVVMMNAGCNGGDGDDSCMVIYLNAPVSSISGGRTGEMVGEEWEMNITWRERTNRKKRSCSVFTAPKTEWRWRLGRDVTCGGHSYEEEQWLDHQAAKTWQRCELSVLCLVLSKIFTSLVSCQKMLYHLCLL